jgi:hypothetical protein
MKKNNDNKQIRSARSIIRLALTAIMLVLFGEKAQATPSFSAVNNATQNVMFYYNIIDATNHYVEITNANGGNYVSTGSYTYDGTTTPLEIPSSVTYNGTNYTVTRIGNHAFFHCSGFTGALNIPTTVTVIDENAFCYCSGLTGALTIPQSVTTIGKFAFGLCTNMNGLLTIPNSVTSINDHAFYVCSNLTGSLIIPSSITTLGAGVFDRCYKLTSISVSGENTHYESIDNVIYGIDETRTPVSAVGCAPSKSGSLTIPNTVTTINDEAFCDCDKLTGTLEIPNSVTTIGYRAFMGCGKLNAVSNINHVITIGTEAFRCCPSLSELMFTTPNRLMTIQVSAFNESGLKGNLVIPNGVTMIGRSAFSYCKNLTGVTIPNTVTSIDSYAFYFSSNCVIYIPDDCTNTTIASHAFERAKGVWFTKTNPSTFQFSGDLGVTTYYIPEDDASTDPQSSSSIKGLYKAKITTSTAKFRYYHLGMKCAQKTLDARSAAKWGQSSVYCSTLYVNFPAVVPKGMTAFYGSGVTDGGAIVRLKSFNNTEQVITDITYPFASNNVSSTRIPTKCGVVLIGNSVPDYATAVGDTIFEADSEPTNETNVGILSGSLTQINTSDVTGGTVYTFGTGATSRTVGFYPYTGTTLNAHKAYLLKTTAMPAKGQGFDVTFDDDGETPTGISGIKNAEGATDNAPYYNLEGMKVNKPAKGGIYIHNGKKIVIY